MTGGSLTWTLALACISKVIEVATLAVASSACWASLGLTLARRSHRFLASPSFSYFVSTFFSSLSSVSRLAETTILSLP
jgi:hypothetical protein